jgi:hypothetical protein
MAADDDVPIGPGAQNYYERQFGDRVRNIRKGSGPQYGGPSRASRSGPSRPSGCLDGAGRIFGGIVVVIVLTLVRAGCRSDSSSRYNYQPPTFPKIQFEQVPPDIRWKDGFNPPPPVFPQDRNENGGMKRIEDPIPGQQRDKGQGPLPPARGR